MQISITKDMLMNALQRVLKAVSANCPIPVLTGIHIQAEADGLVLTTSNASMTIQYKIPSFSSGLAIRRSGSLVVPARYFGEIIRRLDAGCIDLEEREHLILTVTAGSSRIRLCGMDAAGFPSVRHEATGSVRTYRMNSGLLKSSIGQVAPAASTSETRPVLTGVSLKCHDYAIKFAATDGVRFASRALPMDLSADGGIHAVVPAKNLHEIAKMLDEENETTEIEVDANQIRFRTKSLLVQSVLIGGEFPSVHIPEAFITEMIIEKTVLLRAVERVLVLAGANAVKLAAAGGSLDVRSSTAEIGDVHDEVPLKEMHGEPHFSISLNGRFVADMLRCIESEDVTLRYAGKMSPVVLLPADEASSSTLFLITPIRTAD